MRDRLLKPAEVAELLGVTTGTLAQWRSKRPLEEPLPFVKVGHAIRYRESDVDLWLEARTQRA
jgi:excisionase family DNA binding protein